MLTFERSHKQYRLTQELPLETIVLETNASVNCQLWVWRVTQ